MHAMAYCPGIHTKPFFAATLALLLGALFLTPVMQANAGQSTSSHTKCITVAYDPRMGRNIPAFKALFETLYDRAGLCMQFVSMTSRRKETQLFSGKLDADALRVDGYTEYSNGQAIALPQPIFEMPAVFMWLPHTAFGGKPEDLKNHPRIGYAAGFKWIEWNLGKLSIKGIPLPQEDKILDLLKRKRIDLYVTGAVNAASLQMDAKVNGTALLQSNWKPVKFYHILNRKHQALVPTLNRALTKMVRDGDVATLLKDTGLSVSQPIGPE